MEDSEKEGQKTHYNHYDRIGNTVRVTQYTFQGDCELLSEMIYDAFGSIRGDKDDSRPRYRFNSLLYDYYSFLYYMGARYYDPFVGRFVMPLL